MEFGRLASAANSDATDERRTGAFSLTFVGTKGGGTIDALPCAVRSSIFSLFIRLSNFTPKPTIKSLNNILWTSI